MGQTHQKLKAYCKCWGCLRYQKPKKLGKTKKTETLDLPSPVPKSSGKLFFSIFYFFGVLGFFWVSQMAGPQNLWKCVFILFVFVFFCVSPWGPLQRVPVIMFFDVFSVFLKRVTSPRFAMYYTLPVCF